jgi:hypothetical protein
MRRQQVNKDAFTQLVEALNRMADQTGHEAISITFNRSDTPIDYDLATGRWEDQRGWGR